MTEWKAVIGMIEELKRCEAADATVAAVAMTYICMDTMAFLSMPSGQTSQTNKDFRDWAHRYLKGHPSQPYKYDGKDMYAARCSLLHAFSAEAEMHRKDPSVKLFGYYDGGLHRYDPAIKPDFVLIGTVSLINDVVIAIESFMNDCAADASLRQRVEARLPALHQFFPLPNP